MRNITALALVASLIGSPTFAQIVGPGGGSSGGSTNPGGTSGQTQYNNGGSFGGFTFGGDCTLSVPNITCAKLNGVSPGTAYSVNTGTTGHTLGFLDGANTWSAAQTFLTSTTGSASINVPEGVVPTSPNNGDVWTTSAGLFVQIAGSTVGPLGSGGGGSGVSSFNTRTGAVTLSSSDVSAATGALTTANTFTGQQTITTVGASSAPAVVLTGPTFAGTGTTAMPLFYINPGSTPSTSWAPGGTAFGINLPNASTVDLVNLEINGISKFEITGFGNAIVSGNMTGAGFIDGASGTFSWSGRGLLSSPAAAKVQFGAADAATPLAQTITAQNVVAGTSNGAGQLLTIAGSQGTGSGAGGAIQFQVAPSGAAATVQNTEIVALKINQTVHINYGGSAPTLTTCGSSPSLDAAATDSSGTITVGGAVGGTCTLNFNKIYGATPHCRVSAQSVTANLGYIPGTSTLTITATALSGNIDYNCDGV